MEVIRGDKIQEPFGLYNGDTRKLREVFEEQIENKTVEATITSPPYADMKNYEANEDIQIGFGQDYHSYLEELRSIYNQVYDVTSETGTLWVIVNTLKKNHRTVRLPNDIIDVCENLNNKTYCSECNERLVKDRETGDMMCNECGNIEHTIDESWVFQDTVIWNKKRARPWSSDGKLRNVFEYILCFSKNRQGFTFNADRIRNPSVNEFQEWWLNFPERYHPKGKLPDNIWEFTTPTQGSWSDSDVDHPAPFPSEMIQRIIKLSTEENDIVLDPFAGTGTVLAEAQRLNRNPVGFELSKEYSKMFRTRIKELEPFESIQEKEQEKLETVIWSMRQLKYAKEIVKQLREEFNADTITEIGIHTMFQKWDNKQAYLDSNDNELKSTTIISVDSSVSRDKIKNIERTANQIITDKPCSQFGINTVLSVRTIEETVQDVDSDSEMYVYNKSNNQKANAKIFLDDWKSQVENSKEWVLRNGTKKYPPVITNFYLSIPDKDEITLQDIQCNEPDQIELLRDRNTTLNEFN